MSNFNDLTGKIFGRLTVLKVVGKNKCGQAIWLCQCSCENKTLKEIVGTSLVHEKTKSCGCIRRELSKQTLKNTYDLTRDYGIGYTLKGEEFYFDLEDYDRIQKYCWWSNDSNYIVTQVNKQTIRMHRFIMNYNEDLQIDHINGIRYDNRKNNLRIVTNQQNSFNKNVVGVYYDKTKSAWLARLVKDKKLVLFKRFKKYEDAINARKLAELEYFGEYARQCD